MSASEQPDNESERESEPSKFKQPDETRPAARRPDPLFLRDSSEGHKGNAQDEKDEIGE